MLPVFVWAALSIERLNLHQVAATKSLSLSSIKHCTYFEKLLYQGSFEEDYYALAYKSMSAFHWSRHFCHQVILKK